MQEASEYLELSLSGRWISIARKWLEKNAPCSIDDYIVSVSKLMPTHILNGTVRSSQVSLAKEALIRLDVVRENGIVYPPKKKTNGKGFTERIRQDAFRNGYVLREHYPDILNFSSLVGFMVKAGLLVHDSRGKYILNENIEMENK